jgi:hypothetical protein
MPNLTSQGCRAGRALLQWTVRQLGDAAGLRGEAISAFENGRPMRESNKTAILAVFEAHGVEILNGSNPGARMK